jgi:hypothetical protein
VAALTQGRLLALRLAAQRLTPQTAAATPLEATRAVVAIQAQDVRAAGLSLRSRTPNLTRAAIDAEPDLVRSWNLRGTAHLCAAADHPWLHALTGERNARRYEALIEKRGALERALAILPDVESLLADGPLTRADLLRSLAERGNEPLGERAVNVLMPWLVARGTAIGLSDGTFRTAPSLPALDPDEALVTLARRYLAGYGPAAPADLAKFSGLPLSACRRAFDAAGPLEPAGDLSALPGTLDADPPTPPPALLLAAYDTSMLGWHTREPLVRAADDHHVLPGGGIVRPVILARGRAAATWRLAGSGNRRRLHADWFGRRPAAAAIAAEAADVGRFLGLDVDPAS